MNSMQWWTHDPGKNLWLGREDWNGKCGWLLERVGFGRFCVTLIHACDTFEFGLFQFCFDLFDQVIGCFNSLQISSCSIWFGFGKDTYNFVYEFSRTLLNDFQKHRISVLYVPVFIFSLRVLPVTLV